MVDGVEVTIAGGRLRQPCSPVVACCYLFAFRAMEVWCNNNEILTSSDPRQNQVRIRSWIILLIDPYTIRLSTAFRHFSW